MSLLVPLSAWVSYDARPRAAEAPAHLVALASGLSASQAETLRAHLEMMRVPFVMRDGGQTVMVPAGQRAELTVELTQFAARLDSPTPDSATRLMTGNAPLLRDTGAEPLMKGRRAPAQGTAESK